MTLSDVLSRLPMPYADCADMAVVMDQAGADAINAAQASHGTTTYVVEPRPLTDGRWFVCGDLLSEVGPGGLWAASWAAVNVAAISQATIVPMSDVVSLLPEIVLPDA